MAKRIPRQRKNRTVGLYTVTPGTANQTSYALQEAYTQSFNTSHDTASTSWGTNSPVLVHLYIGPQSVAMELVEKACFHHGGWDALTLEK